MFRDQEETPKNNDLEEKNNNDLPAEDDFAKYKKEIEEQKNWWKIEPIVVEYSSPQEIKIRKNDLTEIFDMNFGQDWRVFQALYYDTVQKRHNIAFKKIDMLLDWKITKNRVQALVMRKAHYALSKSLIRIYFNQGFAEALKAIQSNYFRAKFKDLETNELKIYSPSNEMYAKYHEYLCKNGLATAKVRMEDKG